jgi:hypothetical protein
MHMDEITRSAVPVIKGFPHAKLLFDGKSPFVEAFSFDYSEIAEFRTVKEIKPTPKNIMGADGTLRDETGEEYDTYIVYSYDGDIYFLTIVYSDATYTYDFSRAVWVSWSR